MRRSGVFDLARLNLSFEQYGRHDRLVDYLAQPRTHLGARNQEFIDKCKQLLIDRCPFSSLPQIGFAPQDTAIFEKRFNLLGTDNVSYAIATCILPSVSQLETFSMKEPGWSTLFSLKAFLLSHPDLAKVYRGMLPFGSQVIKFYNEVPLGEKITTTPSFKDHVRLMDFTNMLSDQTGSTTVSLNNEMYLEGGRIKEQD